MGDLGKGAVEADGAMGHWSVEGCGGGRLSTGGTAAGAKGWAIVGGAAAGVTADCFSKLAYHSVEGHGA